MMKPRRPDGGNVVASGGGTPLADDPANPSTGQTMTRVKSSTPQRSSKKTSANGEHEPATVELVHDLCKQAKGPALSNDSAEIIARDMNHALCWSFIWRADRAVERDADPKRQRMQRIAMYLVGLQIELPGMIEDSRNQPGIMPTDEPDIVDKLLDLVKQFPHIVDAYPPRTKGRPTSLEAGIAANISQKILGLWPVGTPKGPADAFASLVMGWLTGRAVPPSDQAIKRARSRRTKMP